MAKKIDKLGPRIVQKMEWWSDIDDEILLTNGGTDIDLPDVIVSGIPDEADILMVVAMIRVRAIEDTNGAGGANAINGAQNIRIKKSTGAWGVDDIAAINLDDDQWTVAQGVREVSSLEQIGDNDLSGEVDEDETYNLRFEDATVDLNNLKLNDVQVGIKVYFTTTL